MVATETLVDEVCKTYHIGERLSDLICCSGGLLHQTYQFDTTQARFIIKILHSEIISRAESITKYVITEQITHSFAKYIPAISAITHQNKPIVFFKKQAIMLFPYINGKILTQSEIKDFHIEKIASAIANIHRINLKIVNAPSVEVCNFESLQQLIPSEEITSLLQTNLSAINTVYENCLHYESILKNNTVISHRDCDPKNVLWDQDGHYYIIDWESAGLINKTKDVLTTAIYWSLNDKFIVNINYLHAFLLTYQKKYHAIYADEILAGLYGLLGDWLNWLHFNLLRLINNSSENHEFKLGLTEAKKTLHALPILLAQFQTINQNINHWIKVDKF